MTINAKKLWPWDNHYSKYFQGRLDALAHRPRKTENELTGSDRADTYN